ncbi:MAG: TolC family protein [Treponema sp.]|nr:TolC family protein [Treponema sp.]
MKKFFASLAFAAMIFVPALAQEQEQEKAMTLTVEQAVEFAKENSKTLKSAEIDLEMKKRASQYSWNVFLPKVQASFSAARTTELDLTQANSMISIANGLNQISSLISGNPYVPQEKISEKEKYHWALVGEVSASLSMSLAYISLIRAAKADYECGKITWEQSQKQTFMNIKKLFYGLLLQQESLGVKKATLENARQRAAQAEVNYKNGLIPELRLLNAQVTYENQKPEVESAQQALNQAMDNFVFLIGLPVGTKIQLEGSIEPTYVNVTSDDLLEKYADKSLDYQNLKGAIDSLKLNLSALNLSSYTPALILSYNYQPMKTFVSDDSKWNDQGKFAASLVWNLTDMLPFSANRQKAADIKANLRKLELKMEMLVENQKVQVKKAVDTLNQAREQIDSMGRNITLAQRAYDSSARSYRNGATELLDLRDSESQLNQAKLGQLNQKFNYISALMDLEYTLNADLSSYKE